MASGCAKLSAKAEEVAPKVGLGVKLPPALVVEITEDAIFVDDTSIMRWLSERLPEEDRETMLEVFSRGRVKVVALKNGTLPERYLSFLDDPGHGESLPVFKGVWDRVYDAADFVAPEESWSDELITIYSVEDDIPAITVYATRRSAFGGHFNSYIALGWRGGRARELVKVRLPSNMCEKRSDDAEVRSCQSLSLRVDHDRLLIESGEFLEPVDPKLCRKGMKRFVAPGPCADVFYEATARDDDGATRLIESALDEAIGDAMSCRTMTVFVQDDVPFVQLVPALRAVANRAEWPVWSRLLSFEGRGQMPVPRCEGPVVP